MSYLYVMLFLFSTLFINICELSEQILFKFEPTPHICTTSNAKYFMSGLKINDSPYRNWQFER
jgi:hypothetical protein